jgi:hypothetical protein
LIPKIDEPLGEGGSGFILTGFFIRHLGFEDGMIGAGEESDGVVGVEESFAD